MIIGCPKCGFEQPEVEYCANCGVNIHTFKQKRKPLKERLLKNSYFYLALIILVIISTSIFVKENWFPSEKRVYTFVPTSSQQEANTTSTTWLEEETETTDSSSESRQPASDTKAVASPEAPPKLEIFIVNIPVTSLAYLVGQEVRSADLKRLRAYGVRKALSAKDLSAIPGTSILYSLENIINAFQDPILIQQSVFDPASQDEIGFELNIGVDSYRNHQLIFAANLMQRFYVDKVVKSVEQDLRLEIGEKQSRILTGILPLKSLDPREKPLLQNGYLAIMNTPEFQVAESTFVIVMTYKY